MTFVKPSESSRIIHESMQRGSAKMLDRARVLDDDPAVHRVLLSKAAVRAQATNDPDAWLDVTDGLSKMVFDIAQRYFHDWESHMPAHASFDEVFDAGLEGVVIAVRKYNEATGYMISTYATNWIRTKCQRACYAQCGIARIPEPLLRRGLDPTAPLVGSAAMSIDMQLLEDGTTYGDTITGAADPLEGVEQHQGFAAVIELLTDIHEQLPEIAAMMMEGLGDGKIGKRVGMSAMQVSRLRVLAQERLAASGLTPVVR